MKPAFCIILLLLFLPGTSQELAIENVRENIAFAGVNNWLRCVVNGYSSKNLILTTDNGIIKKEDDSFLFTPKEAGPTTITVWAITEEGRVKIGTHPYRVYRLSPPVAYVGQQKGGRIKKSFLSEMGGVRATLHPGLGICAPLRVVSYSVVAFYKDSCLFSFDNIGAQWGETNKLRLESLLPGATITVYNITCQMLNNENEDAECMVFQIIDDDGCNQKSFYSPKP